MTATHATDAAAPRPNKRVLAKAATRARALDAAGFLFANAGYLATGIRDIADRMKMSTGAVFANFESKDDLWREAMGCPPPDLRLAEEVALTFAACPGAPVCLYIDGDRCKASIGNLAHGLMFPGEGSFHGVGETAAEALRQARIEADRRRSARRKADQQPHATAVRTLEGARS